jgi:uncharacterized protein with NRDE domain
VIEGYPPPVCTLLVAVHATDGLPLAVAANRDERLDRPAERPALRTFGSLSAFAPMDIEAGGTWMGLNDAGVFTALTNRFVPGPTPGFISKGRRSRGLIVADALASSRRADAIDAVQAHGGAAHNPFHLVVADAAGASLIWGDGAELHTAELGPGLHVLTERSFNAAPSGREAALSADRVRLAAAGPNALRDALRVHRADPFDSTCVHADGANYGTRSATLVTLDVHGRWTFGYTDGPSCVTPWEDLSGQIAFNRA